MTKESVSTVDGSPQPSALFVRERALAGALDEGQELRLVDTLNRGRCGPERAAGATPFLLPLLACSILAHIGADTHPPCQRAAHSAAACNAIAQDVFGRTCGEARRARVLGFRETAMRFRHAPASPRREGSTLA